MSGLLWLLLQAFRSDPVQRYFTYAADWSNTAVANSAHGLHIKAQSQRERMLSTPGEKGVALWELYPSEKAGALCSVQIKKC